MADLDLAKKRLETAILRLEALVTTAAVQPAVTHDQADAGRMDAGAPAAAENRALREQITQVHRENVRLRQSLDAMGERMDKIIARLDYVVGGNE